MSGNVFCGMPEWACTLRAQCRESFVFKTTVWTNDHEGKIITAIMGMDNRLTLVHVIMLYLLKFAELHAENNESPPCARNKPRLYFVDNIEQFKKNGAHLGVDISILSETDKEGGHDSVVVNLFNSNSIGVLAVKTSDATYAGLYSGSIFNEAQILLDSFTMTYA